MFYDLGVDCLAKGHDEEAKKWLGRAFNLVQTWDWGSTFDGPELRLNVLHVYTRSLFALGDQNGEGRTLLETMASEYPQRLPVLLLRMERSTSAQELAAALEPTKS